MTAEVLERSDMLLREDAGGVTRLTLNRSKAFNSLSAELMTRLQAELEIIAADRSVRVVVLQGNGPAFSAGHDLKDIRANRHRDYLTRLFQQCSRLMLSIGRLPQPVIARVDGIATAAGCQLVAACDLAICSDRSRFATSGVKYGLFCSTPMVALSRNVARKPAMEMLLTGDFIDAATAKAWGLVNAVAPAEALDAAETALLARLLDKPARVLALGKRAFYRQLEMGLAEAYAFTSEAIVANALAPEAKEGFDAFAEKRAPVWPDEADAPPIPFGPPADHD